MEFQLKQGNFAAQSADCVIVGVDSAGTFSPVFAYFSPESQQKLTELVKNEAFSGAVGELLFLPQAVDGFARVLLVGLGKAGELSARQFKQAVQKAAEALAKTPSTNALWALGAPIALRSAYWHTRFAIEAIGEAFYRFEQFKAQKTTNRLVTSAFWAEANEAEAVQAAVAHADKIVQGIALCKTVANLPPNVCNPAYLADQARALAAEYATIETEIVDEAQMAALGMNAYLAVSRGSHNPAFLSVIRYNNAPAGTKPIVLVGKGLTFDAGGISLKPAEAMDEMKYDMGGAASVLGTMKALAELNLPLNVIGVLAGCENLPDGNAYRPGDILTTMNGLTVEVLNTDAEGRLVLADTLTYVERFAPELVIDLATLTGACVVALGTHNSGLISPDQALAETLLACGVQADDTAWQLPMGEGYAEQLKSNFADLANIGGRWGGAITAGVFLSHFTKAYRWAHFDIAGTAWRQGAQKGATGRPVSLLVEFLLQQANAAQA